MSITRAVARTMIRELADDPDGKRWSDANLDILAGMVIDGLYADILDDQPQAVSLLETVTTLTSPGTIDTSSGGDLTNRLYRVQSIVRNGQTYREADHRNVVLEDGAVISAQDYTYVFFGDELHLFPYSTTEDVEIRYSYRPTKFDLLANDSTAVEWPDGYELAYLTKVAAFAMGKGGVEDPTYMLAFHAQELQRLLSAIRRRSPGPTTMFTNDSSLSWGAIS